MDIKEPRTPEEWGVWIGLEINNPTCSTSLVQAEIEAIRRAQAQAFKLGEASGLRKGREESVKITELGAVNLARRQAILECARIVESACWTSKARQSLEPSPLSTICALLRDEEKS